MEELIRQIYAQAKTIGACNKINGTESFEDIVKLFLSAQGMEFCLKNNFPSINVFRRFKTLQPEKYGIYIDSGNITLRNPLNAVLIGSTNATIFCDKLIRNEVCLFHGANAVINARGWSVVAVQTSSNCQCIRNASENAVIL